MKRSQCNLATLAVAPYTTSRATNAYPSQGLLEHVKRYFTKRKYNTGDVSHLEMDT